MNIRFTHIQFWAGVLVLTSGCSSVMKVDTLDPQLTVVSSRDATAKHVTVLIEPFTLSVRQQGDKYVIGEAKVGAFNSTAHIEDSEGISAAVTHVVDKGFRQAGFTIANAPPADFNVGGSVERLWVDEYATGYSMEYSRASVRIDIIIKNRSGAIVWGNTLEKFVTSTKSMDTTSSDVPTLSQALGEAVDSIFKDRTFWTGIGLGP